MIHSAKAFSLIRMLIVVVVLAVVTALVTPSFSQARIAAGRMDELCSRLQTLRSQIELYKVQHRDVPPMRHPDGTIVFDARFRQMLYCTDVDGNVKPQEPRNRRDTVYTYGPYLKRIPENPFNKSRKIVRARRRSDIPLSGNAGWAYVPETGAIYANDSAYHGRL